MIKVALVLPPRGTGSSLEEAAMLLPIPLGFQDIPRKPATLSQDPLASDGRKLSSSGGDCPHGFFHYFGGESRAWLSPFVINLMAYGPVVAVGVGNTVKPTVEA
jgi:hypothetical protein